MAASVEHTFGAKCRLAPVSRASNEDGRPPVEAQFFYASVIPIDDPLSTSAAQASTESRSSRNQLRPFGRGDNNALEKAWLSLASEQDRIDHDDARHNREQSATAAQKITTRKAQVVEAVAKKHAAKHKGRVQAEELSLPIEDGVPTTPMPACCSELLLDVSEALGRVFCALVRRVTPELDPQIVLQNVLNAMARLRRASSTVSAQQVSRQVPSTETPVFHHDASAMPLEHPADKQRPSVKAEATSRARSISQPLHRPSKLHTPFGSPGPARPPPADDGISGRPFVRVETRDTSVSSSPSQAHKAGSPAPASPVTASFPSKAAAPENSDAALTVKEMEMEHAGTSPAQDDKEIPDTTVEVAVGVSRLHMVSLPMLQMKPIYWSPVNDMAVVTRATWFYR